MADKKITLDKAGSLLDKYADPTPTPKPDSTTKKVKKAKEAIKKKDSINIHANRQLGVLEKEGY